MPEVAGSNPATPIQTKSQMEKGYKPPEKQKKGLRGSLEELLKRLKAQFNDELFNRPDGSNKPFDPERRKVIMGLLGFILYSLLSGCAPEEEQKKQAYHPQIYPSTQNRESVSGIEIHSAFESFISRYAREEVKNYVWRDQIVFSFSGNKLNLYGGSLNEILNKYNAKEIILGERKLVIDIPADRNNIIMTTLRSYLNLPIDGKYTLHLQEIKIGNESFYIPSSWINYSKLRNIQTIQYTLTNEEAQDILIGLARIIHKYRLGVKIENSALLDRIKNYNLSSSEVNPQVLENRFIHALELKGKNSDIGILKKWASDKNIELIVVELRTFSNGVVTRNLGRFLVIAASESKGEIIGTLVLPDNYQGSKIIKDVIGLTKEGIDRATLHYYLRHYRDFPPSIATQMMNIGIQINAQIQNSLDDILTGKVNTLSIGDVKAEIIDTVIEEESFRIRVKIKINSRYYFFEFLRRKNSSFSTFYPVGSIKEGATLPSEILKNLNEKEVRNPSLIKDPLLASFVFVYSLVISSRTEYLVNIKKITKEILKNTPEIKNLLEQKDYFIIILKNLEGVALEVFVHRGADIALRDFEFGYAVNSKLFSINPEEIGIQQNDIVQINFGVIERVKEFKRDVIDREDYQKIMETDGYIIYTKAEN